MSALMPDRVGVSGVCASAAIAVAALTLVLTAGISLVSALSAYRKIATAHRGVTSGCTSTGVDRTPLSDLLVADRKPA